MDVRDAACEETPQHFLRITAADTLYLPNTDKIPKQAPRNQKSPRQQDCPEILIWSLFDKLKDGASLLHLNTLLVLA